MAKAMKCDRCGDFYTENVKHKSTRNRAANIDGMCFTDTSGNTIDYLDLCDDCIDKLFEFIKNPEKETRHD